MMTASKLRQDIYRVLDQILETGVPIEIERRGKRLRIAPVEASSKLDRLQSHDYLVGEPEEIVHLDWSDQWQP